MKQIFCSPIVFGYYMCASPLSIKSTIPKVKQFDWLKKLHDKPKLWASSYYWGTTGNVSAQAVKRYIEECQG